MQSGYDGDFHSAHDRIYGRVGSSRDGRVTLLGAGLAAFLFLLVLSLSARQATGAEPAQRVIESGIASLTDIDQLLADNRDALEQLGRNSTTDAIPIPGYPLDVFLTRDEAMYLSHDELRAAILSRSSALVYTRGTGAFDTTGHQSVSRFSTEGALQSMVGQTSQRTHDRATIATIVFAIAVALLAIGVVAANTGWARLRNLGIAIVVGGLPGLLLFMLLRFFIGRFGGNDPFIEDLRSIVQSVVSVPLRNFFIVTLLGAFLTIVGVGAGLADRRQDDWPPEDDEGDRFGERSGGYSGV